jgi:hypothetical protein
MATGALTPLPELDDEDATRASSDGAHAVVAV